MRGTFETLAALNFLPAVAVFPAVCLQPVEALAVFSHYDQAHSCETLQQ